MTQPIVGAMDNWISDLRRNKIVGTKNNPGKFDCYSKADPDEPLFTLRAKDPLGEFLVATWVALKAGDLASAKDLMATAIKAHKESGKPSLPYMDEKLIEAQQCAKEMREWRVGKQVDEIQKRLDGTQ